MRNIKRDFKEFQQALLTLKFWWMLFAMTLGCLIFSTVVNAVLIPHHFFSGGLTGIALLIFDYSQDFLHISILIAILNIPIFILGFKEFSFKFIFTSFLGVIIYSFSLEITDGIEISVNDPMLAAIFGGVLAGFSTGFYLNLGGSVGGLDILGFVIKKRYEIPIGTVYNLVNFTVILSNAILFDLETSLYTGIFMYVFSWSMQKVQTGFSQRKSVFIISEKPDEIAKIVLKKVDRGFTYFYASGGYNKEEKKVIYTVINLIELGRLKEYLFETDPDAFISIQDTADVIGKRFLSWEDQGFKN
tara:strand:- start:4238 stop:5143 length:906 start_codon:yes stop_codon:yes gene_type:complete